MILFLIKAGMIFYSSLIKCASGRRSNLSTSLGLPSAFVVFTDIGLYQMI